MIAIVGAGPIGCYLASLLAKEEEVYVFEEHSEIGKPVQCTGLVTDEIKRFVKLKKEFIVNEIKDVRVYSKNNFIDLRLKKNFLLNREKFDRYMAEKAERAGAKIFLNTKFLGYKDKKILVKQDNKIKRFSFDYLIGADGVMSKVNEVFFKNERKILVGLQARFKKKKKSDEKDINFYVSEGKIGWVVFENKNFARVGVVDSSKVVKKSFRDFVARTIKDYRKNLVEYQSGPIPLYNPKDRIVRSIDDKKVFLVGDAAGQVKATTFGGIVQGLTAAKILKDVIIEGKDYMKELKRLNRELKIHLFLRKVMDTFSSKDYDFLIEIMKAKRNREIIKRYNRDEISKIFLRVLLKDVRIFYFLKNLAKGLFYKSQYL